MDNTSTLDKILAIADKVSIAVPVAGQFIQIADVSVHALAALLDRPDTDKAKLESLHEEYQRRIALAENPNT